MTEKFGLCFRDTDDNDVFRCVGASSESIVFGDAGEGEQRKVCFRYISKDDPFFTGSLDDFVFDDDNDDHFYTPVDEIFSAKSSSGVNLYVWL